MTALDQNKTALTHRVTATAIAYLDGLGCKPIETEVQVAREWVADIATFWYPTQTEWKKAHLDKRFGSPTKAELYQAFRRFCHRYATPLTVLVEVKTTLADFKKDAGRKLVRGASPASLSFIACPRDLYKKVCADLDYHVGVILTAANGQSVVKTYPPHPEPHHSGDMIDFIAAVAVRRDHRTRYKAERDFMRMWKAKEAMRRKAHRIDQVVRGILDYCQRKGPYYTDAFAGLTAALKYHGAINGRAHESTMRRIRELDAWLAPHRTIDHSKGDG